ncbi:hypothetical protein JW906_10035 [bacterium]|nr:hypothetical protein [bacterium]
MDRTNRHFGVQATVVIFLSLIFQMCASQENREISTRKELVSCRYIGLGEKNGRPVVNLVFKNTSGKDMQTVFGGLRIIDQTGRIVQRIGFTYSLPFAAGSEKRIAAFEYNTIQAEALALLSSATDYIPMTFELAEVIYKDGQSVTF